MMVTSSLSDDSGSEGADDDEFEEEKIFTSSSDDEESGLMFHARSPSVRRRGSKDEPNGGASTSTGRARPRKGDLKLDCTKKEPDVHPRKPPRTGSEGRSLLPPDAGDDDLSDELTKLSRKLKDIETRLDKNERRVDKELHTICPEKQDNPSVASRIIGGVGGSFRSNRIRSVTTVNTNSTPKGIFTPITSTTACATNTKGAGGHLQRSATDYLSFIPVPRSLHPSHSSDDCRRSPSSTLNKDAIIRRMVPGRSKVGNCNPLTPSKSGSNIPMAVSSTLQSPTTSDAPSTTGSSSYFSLKHLHLRSPSKKGPSSPPVQPHMTPQQQANNSQQHHLQQSNCTATTTILKPPHHHSVIQQYHQHYVSSSPSSSTSSPYIPMHTHLAPSASATTTSCCTKGSFTDPNKGASVVIPSVVTSITVGGVGAKGGDEEGEKDLHLHEPVFGSVKKSPSARRSLGQRLQKSSTSVLRAATSTIHHHVPSLLLPHLKSEKKNQESYSSMDSVNTFRSTLSDKKNKIMTNMGSLLKSNSKSKLASRSVTSLQADEEYNQLVGTRKSARRSPLRAFGNFVDDKLFKGRLSLSSTKIRSSMDSTSTTGSRLGSLNGASNDSDSVSGVRVLAEAVLEQGRNRSNSSSRVSFNEDSGFTANSMSGRYRTDPNQASTSDSGKLMPGTTDTLKVSPSNSLTAGSSSTSSSHRSRETRLPPTQEGTEKGSRSKKRRKYRAYSTPSSRELIQDLLMNRPLVGYGYDQNDNDDDEDDVDDLSGSGSGASTCRGNSSTLKRNKDMDPEGTGSLTGEIRPDLLAEIEAFERMASEFMQSHQSESPGQ